MSIVVRSYGANEESKGTGHTCEKWRLISDDVCCVMVSTTLLAPRSRLLAHRQPGAAPSNSGKGRGIEFGGKIIVVVGKHKYSAPRPRSCTSTCRAVATSTCMIEDDRTYLKFSSTSQVFICRHPPPRPPERVSSEKKKSRRTIKYQVEKTCECVG